MSKGLSLAKMHKVSEDKDSATFRHKDGHEIKVAISGLTPKLREELKKIPVKMAEGSDDSKIPDALNPNDKVRVDPVIDAINSPIEPDKPAASLLDRIGASITAMGDSERAAAGAGQAPAAVQPQQAAPQTGLAPQPQAPVPEAAPAQVAAAVAPQPDAQPQAKAAAPAPPPEPKTPESHMSDTFNSVMKEGGLFGQDIRDGHITPKTYRDLLAKNADGSEKSTLGKIGTFFAMMVGGAGAGLSHQPNILMEMMNNEIKNDVDAQNKSKDNAHNFLRLTQQSLLNEAQMKGMDITNKAVLKDIEIKAFGLTRIKSNIVAFDDLRRKIEAMPPGSKARQDGMNMLAILSQQMNAENTSVATRTAAASALANFGGPAGQGGEEQFQQENRTLELSGRGDMAKTRKEQHIPGVKGAASNTIPQDARERLEKHDVLDDKLNDVLEFARKHNKPKDLANPQTMRRAKQKAKELIIMYNGTVDRLGMTGGRMNELEKQIDANPNNPLGQIMGSLAALEEIKTTNLGKKKILLNQQGFPEQPAAKSGGGVEPEFKMMNGAKFKKVPGGWQKVK